jgi:long-chain fatty acid transport protein
MKNRLTFPFRSARSWSSALSRHHCYAVVLLCFTAGMTAWAEGFRNPPPGTFNLGRSGGRIAHVDDSSAVTQNPANLTDLKTAEVQFTPSIVYMGVEFDSAAGQSSETEDPWKLLPNLFMAMPLENTNIAIGLGITAPFGLSVNWDNEGTSAFAPPGGVLRYTSAHYAELMTMNFNPTVAFKLTDNLSLGLGLDVMWSRLTLKRF